MAIGKCKVCGSDINERMKFCSACGTPIERPIAPEAPMATIAPEAPTTQTGPVMPVAPIMPVAQEAPIVQEAPIAPTTPEAPIVPATPEAPVAPVVSAAAAPVPIESAATAPVSSPSEPVSIPPAPAVVPSEAAAYAPAPALVPPASAAYASAAVVVPPAPAAPPVYAPATADASTPAAPPTYAPTAAAAAPEPAVKSVSTLHAMAKLFAKPVIVAVAVVIAAAVVWNIVKPAKYGQEKAMLSIQQADDTVVVTINGKQTAEIEGYQRSASGNFGRSLDNTKAIILVEEERNSGDSEGYALYTQDGKMIADGVVSAQISLSGEGVAFVQDADFRARVGELCLYTGGKTTSITVDYNLDGNLILSPNGKTVAYTIMDDDDVVACYYDGKTHELGDNLTPVAVADGAKYVYYYNRNNSYYVQPGANSDKKEMLGKNVISMHFNRSLSQVVYSAPVENAQGAANQEKTYISRNGGAKSDLRGTFRGFVTPSGTAENDWAADVASF
ncbi:MAG: hypothetical protein LBU58_04830, partial [Clostridiales bacterium]|nr:hypothetical protein [Clostridiales bacterium]